MNFRLLVAFWFGLISFSAFAAEPMRYAIIGDAGVWNGFARQVRDSVARSGIRSLILPGDNLYNTFFSSYDAVWSNWKTAGFTLDVVAIGNHTRGYAEETRYFGMPGEFYAARPASDVMFIVLNSDNVGTASEQAQWLDATLSQSADSLVFIVMHHPPRTVTRFHSWQERRGFHEATLPVIMKHRSKITSLIVGHDHVALAASYDTLPVILSGAVHDTRTIEMRNEIQEGVQVKTHWVYDRQPTWADLDLTPENREARIRFIRSKDDRSMCEVRIPTGKPLVADASCARIGTP